MSPNSNITTPIVSTMSTTTERKIIYTGIRRKRIYPSMEETIKFPLGEGENLLMTRHLVMDEVLASYLPKDVFKMWAYEFWSYLKSEYRGAGSVMPDKCTPEEWIKREYAFWSAPDSEDDE